MKKTLIGMQVVLAALSLPLFVQGVKAQPVSITVADYSVEDVAGIFGELDPPRQFIQGVRKNVTVNERQHKAYEVISVLNQEDSFNGWVAEKKNTPNWGVRGNWTRVQGGKLVFVVSKGRQCALIWKVEVVATNADNGADDKFEIYVDLASADRAQEAESFSAGNLTEIAIPLAAFELKRLNPITIKFVTVRPNLAAVKKVTIVFEEKVLSAKQQPNTSILNIHSIRVISPQQANAGN